MRKRRSVALLIETSNNYARGLLDGIIAYQREHELWSIHLGEHERGAKPPAWFRSWRGDGVIARIETEAIARAVRRLGLPAVDVSAARRAPAFPWVETDDEAIAQLAVEHLRERGFATLAYCGDPQFNWSRWREGHFATYARQAGCECHVFRRPASGAVKISWPRERKLLAAWLRALPKPVGVMACYDFRGQQILELCRELGIAVPEQLAVIGVDDDARLCRLCTPPLSSVIPDAHRAGYEAAKLLERMMNGKQVPPDALLIPPRGIAERQSSDAYAVDDPDVVAALRYIRQHACEGISVGDVLAVVPLSRRMLEHRFQKLAGRTPHAEIIRIRLERVSRLLRETDLTLDEIAARTGFPHAEYLSVVFKRRHGQAPGAYRRKIRAGGAQPA